MHNEVIGCGYSPDAIRRGKQTLDRAKLWRMLNPQAWDYIVLHALDLADKQQPIGAQYLIECVRKKAFVDFFGNDTRTNNSFAPIFARWLTLEHPETSNYIERRRSVYDALEVRYE